MFYLKSLLLVLFAIVCCTVEAQDTKNHVMVQFDLVQLPDWKPEVLTVFKKRIAGYINELCNVNMTYCGITSTSAFTQENVVIEDGYPKVVDVNSLMLFAVTIPKTGNDVNIYVYVRKVAVADVVTTNRKEIQQALITAANEPYEASFRISFVDNELVLEMSDQTLNLIISPIACAVVVLMTIVILGLEARKRMKMKKEVKKIVEKNTQKDRLLKA